MTACCVPGTFRAVLISKAHTAGFLLTRALLGGVRKRAENRLRLQLPDPMRESPALCGERNKVMKQFRVAAFLVLFGALAANAQSSQPASYSWKNVQIVGGGFVDGVIFHPTAPGVRYARTDMGGAYRWNTAANRWQPILDWVPYKDLNLMGI